MFPFLARVMVEVFLQQGSTARGGAHTCGDEELEASLCAELDAIQANYLELSPQQLDRFYRDPSGALTVLGSRCSASWPVWTRVAAIYGSGMCLCC